MLKWKRLIGWPWFVKAEKREPMVTGWESEPFYAPIFVVPDGWSVMPKAEKLAFLARRNETIHAEIMRLRRNKKRFTHLLEDQRAIRNERLRIEGGV